MTEKSPMSGMSQGATFVFGIVAGILVLCTVGFFILLFGQFEDDGESKTTNTNTAPTVVNPPAGDAVPTEITVAPVTEDDHVLGNEDAKITLVEYSDFDCPFCSTFAPTVKQAVTNYPDDVRVVYRHFPLRSIHPQAAAAANASECAAEQGKFWEFHDELFANQGNFSPATYTRIARDLGMNVSTFDACVSSNKYAAAVQEDEATAQQAGGRGTPYTIILGPNGETVPVSGAQPYSAVDAAIQQML